MASTCSTSSALFAVSLTTYLTTAATGSVMLVNDNFDNRATSTGTHTAIAAVDPLDANWGRSNTAGNENVGAYAAAGNTSNALVYTTTSTFQGALGSFTSQMLNLGYSMRLSFDFRLTATTLGDSGGGMRFGLANSNQTYGLVFGTGATAGASINWYNSSTQLGGTATPLTTSGTPILIDDNDSHEAVFSLTRSAGGSTLLIDACIDSSEFTASKSISNFTFNHIIVQSGGVINPFNLDNVMVTITPAPEPASLALAGVATAGLGLRRRRHA